MPEHAVLSMQSYRARDAHRNSDIMPKQKNKKRAYGVYDVLNMKPVLSDQHMNDKDEEKPVEEINRNYNAPQAYSIDTIVGDTHREPNVKTLYYAMAVYD